jgi:hypothetical protein
LEDNISDFNILFDLELKSGLNLLRGQQQQENWIMLLIEVHPWRTFQSRGKPSSRMTSAMILNMRGEIWVLISVVASNEWGIRSQLPTADKIAAGRITA